jgi:hypothetical protein
MCSNTHNQCSKVAIVGALATFTFLSMPAVAAELTNLGPVPPHEPILTSVGSSRVIAFYLPDSNQCALHAVVWDKTKVDSDTSARIRISLEPGQTVHIDSVEGESLNLRCGRNAESLALVDTDEAVAFGIIARPSQQPISASVSGF